MAKTMNHATYMRRNEGQWKCIKNFSSRQTSLTTTDSLITLICLCDLFLSSIHLSCLHIYSRQNYSAGSRVFIYSKRA